MWTVVLAAMADSLHTVKGCVQVAEVVRREVAVVPVMAARGDQVRVGIVGPRTASLV